MIMFLDSVMAAATKHPELRRAAEKGLVMIR
jgi:hypothetical protein